MDFGAVPEWRYGPAAEVCGVSDQVHLDAAAPRSIFGTSPRASQTECRMFHQFVAPFLSHGRRGTLRHRTADRHWHGATDLAGRRFRSAGTRRRCLPPVRAVGVDFFRRGSGSRSIMRRDRRPYLRAATLSAGENVCDCNLVIILASRKQSSIPHSTSSESPVSGSQLPSTRDIEIALPHDGRRRRIH